MKPGKIDFTLQVSTLCWAVYNNDFDMLTRLVENGADLEAKVFFLCFILSLHITILSIFRAFSFTEFNFSFSLEVKKVLPIL